MPYRFWRMIISLPFESNSDWLADETSTSKSLECNFLIDRTSPRIKWRVLGIGKVFLNELSEILLVHWIMKIRIIEKFCSLLLFTEERNRRKWNTSIRSIKQKFPDPSRTVYCRAHILAGHSCTSTPARRWLVSNRSVDP